MRDIRTKQNAKDIKVLKKSINVENSMKCAHIRTKGAAEQAQGREAESPVTYAENTVTGTAQAGAQASGRTLWRYGQSSAQKTADRMISHARERRANGYDRSGTDGGTRQGSANGAENGRAPDNCTDSGRQKIVNERARTAGDGIKQKNKGAIKTGAGGSIKMVQNDVNTARQGVRTVSSSTAQAAGKSAQTAAKAAKASAQKPWGAAQRAKTAAKATARTVKKTAKAVASVTRAIIAAVRTLITVLAAGGWVILVIILFFSVISLILDSAFGIFFSGEDTGSGETMSDAVSEINKDYEEKLSETKAAYTYDVLEMSGSRAVWKEVLSVYAVKTTTDPDSPQEVATVTDEKEQILESIFWEMNEVSAQTETKTEEEVVESDDGNGNIVEEEETVTQTYLYITVSHKTADEMAEEYGFNADQLEQLSELLDNDNGSLWSEVLYGITGSDDQIVSVAFSQIGDVGGEQYWSWYGFSSRVEWCACFVSWCANECGYIDNGVIPKFAGVSTGINWFQERGEWQDGSFEPVAGDLIFFDWEGDGEPDHVGIVEKCEDGTVYTVEGNSGDSCVENTYTVGNSVIYGYGVPAY